MEKVNLENWKDYLDECGELHNEDCCVNSNTCDAGAEPFDCCENMQFLKNFISQLIKEETLRWADALKNHRKHCSQGGNKELTKIKKSLL